MSRYDRPSHRVFMTFFLRSGWQVQFLEADLRTPLPRKFTFTDPDKIRELARKGEAWRNSESRQMPEVRHIENGRGGDLPEAHPRSVRQAEALLKPDASPVCVVLLAPQPFLPCSLHDIPSTEPALQWGRLTCQHGACSLKSVISSSKLLHNTVKVHVGLIQSRTARRAPISVKIEQPNGNVHRKVCFHSKLRVGPDLGHCFLVFSQD